MHVTKAINLKRDFLAHVAGKKRGVAEPGGSWSRRPLHHLLAPPLSLCSATFLPRVVGARLGGNFMTTRRRDLSHVGHQESCREFSAWAWPHSFVQSRGQFSHLCQQIWIEHPKHSRHHSKGGDMGVNTTEKVSIRRSFQANGRSPIKNNNSDTPQDLRVYNQTHRGGLGRRWRFHLQSKTLRCVREIGGWKEETGSMTPNDGT